MRVVQFPVLPGSANPGAMTCAAPKRDAPGRFNFLKTSTLVSQESVASASRTFTIFYGWVRTIPVHARFS